MKKRFLVLCMIIGLLFCSTVAYAANSATVKATITKVKMYFNGQGISGNVLSVDKKYYIPADILKSHLGYNTSIASNKLTITDKLTSKKINVYVDDNIVEMADASGNQVEAFVKDGIVYLPAETMAEAVGKPYSWDGSSFSVYIGKHNSDKPSVMIENVDYLTDNGYFKLWTGPKDNTGQTYKQGLICYMRSAEREILLNGDYSCITGTFIMNYDYRNVNYKGTFTIYGDGNVLYTSTLMQKGVLPEKFDVDLTGVLRLKIVLATDTNEATYDNVFGIADVGLYQ